MRINRGQLKKLILESFEGKPGKWKYDVVSIGKYDDVSVLTPEDIKSVIFKVVSGPGNIGKEFPLAAIEENEGIENYKNHPLVLQILDAIKNNQGLEGVKIQTQEEMERYSKPNTSSIGSAETPSSTSSLEGGGFINVTPDMLTSAVTGIANDTATYALSSFRQHYQAGKIKNNHKMLIVDYRIPGSDVRLWCVEINDAGTISTRIACPVAHGSGDPAKGHEPASRFSNRRGSNTASVGACVTVKKYYSKAGKLKNYPGGRPYNGLAMRIKGLDSTNNRDLRRGIIIHGAWYRENGKTGRSYGCLATAAENNKKIVDFVGIGTFVYKFGGAAYADKVDTSWLKSSPLSESLYRKNMKLTKRHLRNLISEVMIGFPDDRPPFDADTALKTAKRKIEKEPALADMFNDEDNYDVKRHAYSLGSLAADLTDDESVAADIASDIMKNRYYDNELDPDRIYSNLRDQSVVEQPLQGIVKDLIPELEIKGHNFDEKRNTNTTTYLTPDKEYAVLITLSMQGNSILDREGKTYDIKVQKYNPRLERYERAKMGKFEDGTPDFAAMVAFTKNFHLILEDLRYYLEERGSL